MKCPNCGAEEKTLMKTCSGCGEAFVRRDLLELCQLQFLVDETAKWKIPDNIRQDYIQRLDTLRYQLTRHSNHPSETAVAAAPAEIPAPVQAKPAPVAAAIEPTAPPKETIPFDQWLLSERNIKIALYSGAALLVLAGLIFVGVNWRWIPGPAKFAITFMITALMYLGGYLLYLRPTLRLGGVAVLGVAAGFVPLNFVVLQIYIFGPRGLSANMMWLIGSLPTLLLYVLTAYWARADLFIYLSLAAVVSGLTAALVLIEAPLLAFGLAYAVLSLTFLLAARILQPTRLASFTCKPLLIVSQVAMSVILLLSILLFVGDLGCQVCPNGRPWLALASMLTGVIFYIISDIAFGWLIARWVASFAFAITFFFTLFDLSISNTTIAVLLMVLALAYLLVGHALERRGVRRAAVWPLYAAGYITATFVTIHALLNFSQDPDDLAKVLIADVALLAVSAWVHRQYEWVYGATWLFIAPVSIYTSLYITGLTNQGLVLGVLTLSYVIAGYMLGRRALRLGWPFLTAAVFLSLVVFLLTWNNAAVASIVLSLIAVLYLLAAFWLRWSWLLLPALVAVNVAVVTILRIFFNVNSPWLSTLTTLYAVLGTVLILVGAWLRRARHTAWGWPLYIVGIINVAGSYIFAVFLAGPIAIGLSMAFALLLIWLSWDERAVFANAKLPPLLTYLGIALTFIGHFFVLSFAEIAWLFWAPYTAGLCALFVGFSWLIQRRDLDRIYGTPLHRSGIFLMVVPLLWAVFSSRLWWFFSPSAETFSITTTISPLISYSVAGAIFLLDGLIRRSWTMVYLGSGAFVVVLWYLLNYFGVDELQAYVMPLGFGLLMLGWNERRRGGRESYRLPTLLGLLILMGFSFYQSLEDAIYAILLLVESLAAVVWGIRTHSRSYVQFGVISLIINSIAQLGPGFIELSRWIQLGIIGGILLGGGLIALFKRDELLATRKQLTENWSQWQA